jgi:formyltetrahydrofolate synthetase
MKPIVEVASKIGIPQDSVLSYGNYKAKISLDFINIKMINYVGSEQPYAFMIL